MWLWLPAVSQTHSWRIGVSWHSNSTRIRTNFSTSVFPLIIWKDLCESLMLYFQVAQRATEYETKKVLVTFYRVSSKLFRLFKQEAYVHQVTWEKQHVWVGENCPVQQKCSAQITADHRLLVGKEVTWCLFVAMGMRQKRYEALPFCIPLCFGNTIIEIIILYILG